MSNNITYLGDSVYAEYDGYGIWLRTDHHEEYQATNNIYLEPELMQSLVNFANMKKELKNVEQS